MVSGNAISTATLRWLESVEVAKQPIMKSSELPEIGKPRMVSMTGELQFNAFHGLTEFLQVSAAARFTNPVTVHGDRVHVAEKEMELGKPYSVKYGKNTIIIRKASDNKIHVYKLS